MRAVYRALAEEVGECDGALVIGMAETAIGLGAGVAEELARLDERAEVLYQHTTRHRVTDENEGESRGESRGENSAELNEWVRFDEVHSHAPDQLLYQPTAELLSALERQETLVLVDDEITSGRTLTQLALNVMRVSPSVREVVFAVIVSWLTPERARAIEVELGVPLRVVSLLSGAFEFTPDEAFRPTLPGQVTPRHAPPPARSDLGRRGVSSLAHHAWVTRETRRELDALIAKLDRGRPVAVIGTGEFSYEPFLLAERLEREGFEVTYQSTTRSPILVGEAIRSSLSFEDEQGEGVSSYLHNPPSQGQDVVICYESRRCADQHALGGDLTSRELNVHIWICPERR